MKVKWLLIIFLIWLIFGVLPAVKVWGKEELKNDEALKDYIADKTQGAIKRETAAGTKQAVEISSSDIHQGEIPAICILGKKVRKYPFYVYKDGDSSENKFYASGMMGDFNDVLVDLYNKDDPYEGASAVKIVYKPGAARGGRWAGVYWQYPANNWGEAPTGFDLRIAKRLTFWAKGRNGGEVINTFQIGGIIGKYGDTAAKGIGPIVLSEQWQKYTIELRNVEGSIIFSRDRADCWPFMAPLSRIVGGFCWATSLDANSNKENITFYLDEIRFEAD